MPRRKRCLISQMVPNLFIQCTPLFRFTLVPLLTKWEQLNLSAIHSDIRKMLIPYIIPLHVFSDKSGPPSTTLRPFIRRFHTHISYFFDPQPPIIYWTDLDVQGLHYLQISLWGPQCPSLNNLSNLRHLGLHFAYRYPKINPDYLPLNVKSMNVRTPDNIYLENSHWPITLTSLYMSGSPIGPGADRLPSSLLKLRYDGSKVTQQWMELPFGLQSLNALHWKPCSFPDSLTKLIIKNVDGYFESFPPNLCFLKMVQYSRMLPPLPSSLTHLDLTTYNEEFTQGLPNLIVLKLATYRFHWSHRVAIPCAACHVPRSLRLVYLPMGSMDIGLLPKGCRYTVGSRDGFA